jgi:hypothetical protein
MYMGKHMYAWDVGNNNSPPSGEQQVSLCDPPQGPVYCVVYQFTRVVLCGVEEKHQKRLAAEGFDDLRKELASIYRYYLHHDDDRKQYPSSELKNVLILL